MSLYVGERSTAKNYRPVSLLSMVSKVFEKLVNNRIVDHLEKCVLFPDFQYGFRSSRSTADLLTVISARIASAFNRSGATPGVALDISKAFDRVWHAGPLHKLKERLPFARDLSLENSADSYLCFRLAQTTTLPRWLTFLLGSQTLTLTVLLVWIYLFLLTLVFVLHCQILIMLLFQFPLIPHRKYQVKPHSSPWFSPAYAAAIVHRNHFFCLYQQNESSESKVKFRQTSNRSKKVLETAKLACANKTKESITSQKLASRNF